MEARKADRYLSATVGAYFRWFPVKSPGSRCLCKLPSRFPTATTKRRHSGASLVTPTCMVSHQFSLCAYASSTGTPAGDFECKLGEYSTIPVQSADCCPSFHCCTDIPGVDNDVFGELHFYNAWRYADPSLRACVRRHPFTNLRYF